MRRAILASAMGGAVLALTACSQISALTPVGGDSITSVRVAVYDVLVEQGVDLLVAPTCSTSAGGFTCSGTTLDGGDIEARAGAKAPYDLVITIEGSTIFEGTANDVLQDAVEVAS